MKKLNMQTPDLTAGNIAKIAELFPSVIIEREGKDGAVEKAVDFDLLRQVLHEDLVEGDDERYRLDWPGKRASLLKANTPIQKTLRPDRESSVNFNTTQNLFIEGDNFEVLKILQESYLGKIKMIYIDPPYNTGRDFVYKDNFSQDKEEYEEELGVEDEEGGKLFRNTDTNGRFHSDWLSMMYERLVIARDLLKDDGVIFISIDDNEQVNLKKICNEIFGENNEIGNFVVVRSEGGGLAAQYVKGHDYLLAYAKSLDSFEPLRRPKDIRGVTIEKNGKEYWIETDWLRKEFGKYGTLHYEDIEEIKGVKKKNEIDEGLKTGKFQLIDQKGGKHIVGRLRLIEEDGSKFYSILKHLSARGNDDLAALNLGDFFDFPKPISLLKELTLGATFFSKSEEDIVLDFFSGSATSADAVMALNAEDGGNRRFVMVQVPEETPVDSEARKAGYETIAEIGKERIRRAGKKIIEENKEKLALRTTPLDIGFRVYKTDTTNMKDVYYHPSELKQDLLPTLTDNIKGDRTPEDLLTQVILDLGLELSLPVEKKEVRGNTVYFVQGNALVACFDDVIDFAIVDEIAKSEPLKVVFKDASFKKEQDRTNVETRFKRLSPETVVTVL